MWLTHFVSISTYVKKKMESDHSDYYFVIKKANTDFDVKKKLVAFIELIYCITRMEKFYLL